MKKTFLALCGAGLLLMTACNNDKNKEYEERAQSDSIRIAELTSNYNEASTFNDSLVLLMGDIYNGLDSINMQEGLLYNMGNGETDRRAEVRRNLTAIKERLAANKNLLAQMERKLKESGNENSVLAKTIEQLKQRLEQQDEHIAFLENQLAAKNDTITHLTATVAEKEQQVQAQTEAKEAAIEAYNEADKELNTVYYAIGTNKELKQNGLLEKKFLGQTKVLKGDDINTNYFTTVDKRTFTSLDTHAKKIKIWTNMPAGSYEEVKNEEGIITLKITKPNEFWSFSPYLIIQTDK